MSREFLCLVGSLCQGWLWARLYQRERREDWASTGWSLETRVLLECEREYQEHLLLSVMPAYIAAEVRLSRDQSNSASYSVFKSWSQAGPGFWTELLI